MKLWLSDEFVIETPLAPGEVAAVIGTETQERFTCFSWAPVKMFHGTVSGSGFRLRRISLHRRGFPAVAVGNITPSASGSTVVVRTGLSPANTVLWCVSSGLVGVLGIGVFYAALYGNQSAWSALFFIVGILAVSYAFRAVTFWYDVASVRSALCRLLASAIASEPSHSPAAG